MKRKIKWGNVIKAIILIGCVWIIGQDILTVLLTYARLTYFGILTHLLSWYVALSILIDFDEQTKNIPSYKPKHAKDIK